MPLSPIYQVMLHNCSRINIGIVLLQAPFAAIVAFGLYSVAAVLHGVFTFQDCPEEAASLRKVCPPGLSGV